MLAPDLLILPSAILVDSPSHRDGIGASLEHRYRIFGCELIQECGILLKLPQVVMASAQTFLHRFYYRKSLQKFDAHITAMTCLFLALKVEETPLVSLVDILNVCYTRKLRRQGKSLKLLLLGGRVSRNRGSLVLSRNRTSAWCLTPLSDHIPSYHPLLLFSSYTRALPPPHLLPRSCRSSTPAGAPRSSPRSSTS